MTADNGNRIVSKHEHRIDVRVAEMIKGFTEKKPCDEGYEEDTGDASPVDARMLQYRMYIMEVSESATLLSC
jgi:hypothetical protein